MESVVKLLEFVEHTDGWGMMHSHVQTIKEIADAIEQEHAKLLDEARSNAWNQGFDDGYSDADEALNYREDDLAEHGYYRWKNADGETIHIGDKVSTEEFDEVEVEGFIHNAVAFYNYSGQPAYLCTSPANLCRHHHAPTVEDVLREFAHVGIHIGAKDGLVAGEFDFYADEDSIAKYAAKLRLAGDGE